MCVLGMGKVHGMETPWIRSINYESEAIQGGRRSRGSSGIIEKERACRNLVIQMDIYTGV